MSDWQNLVEVKREGFEKVGMKTDQSSQWQDCRMKALMFGASKRGMNCQAPLESSTKYSLRTTSHHEGKGVNIGHFSVIWISNISIRWLSETYVWSFAWSVYLKFAFKFDVWSLCGVKIATVSFEATWRLKCFKGKMQTRKPQGKMKIESHTVENEYSDVTKIKWILNSPNPLFCLCIFVRKFMSFCNCWL